MTTEDVLDEQIENVSAALRHARAHVLAWNDHSFAHAYHWREEVDRLGAELTRLLTLKTALDTTNGKGAA